MKDYTWYYGLFHWTIHFLISIGILYFSGIAIFPIYTTYGIFGSIYDLNVIDYLIVLIITVLFDLDHISMWKKVGIKKIMYARRSSYPRCTTSSSSLSSQ